MLKKSKRPGAGTLGQTTREFDGFKCRFDSTSNDRHCQWDSHQYLTSTGEFCQPLSSLIDQAIQKHERHASRARYFRRLATHHSLQAAKHRQVKAALERLILGGAA